jgi:hypothetical protein
MVSSTRPTRTDKLNCTRHPVQRLQMIEGMLFSYSCSSVTPFVRQKYNDEAYIDCNNVVSKIVTGLDFTLGVSQRMCRGAL